MSRYNDERVLEQEHALIDYHLEGYKKKLREDFLLHADIQVLATGEMYKAVCREETEWDYAIPNDFATRYKNRFYDLWIDGKTYKMKGKLTPGAGCRDNEYLTVIHDGHSFRSNWLWELVQQIIKYNKQN